MTIPKSTIPITTTTKEQHNVCLLVGFPGSFAVSFDLCCCLFLCLVVVWLLFVCCCLVVVCFVVCCCLLFVVSLFGCCLFVVCCKFVCLCVCSTAPSRPWSKPNADALQQTATADTPTANKYTLKGRACQSQKTLENCARMNSRPVRQKAAKQLSSHNSEVRFATQGAPKHPQTGGERTNNQQTTNKQQPNRETNSSTNQS